MATLKQIRARIKAARNIQQITKAMKLVAAARLRRATDRVVEARPYADKLRGIMESLASAGDLPSHPLLEKREIRRACLILVTSDRGLAGAFNSSLIRKAADFIKTAGFDVTLFTYGKKGTTFFTKRGYSMQGSILMPSAGAQFEDALKVTKETRALFESGEIDAIFVCYSKFFSPIRQVPQIVQVLPVEVPVVQGNSQASGAIEFEPAPGVLLDALLPRYFMTLVWQAMLESTASEFGARMSAMTSATDSAGKMIQNLSLQANRERQSSITTQILEIVGGAEALNS